MTKIALVDDEKNATVLSASSLDKSLKKSIDKAKNKIEKSFLEEIYKVNLKGPILLTSQISKKMIKRKFLQNTVKINCSVS